MPKLILCFLLFLTTINIPTPQIVRFTSYYTGDGTGAGSCTASGKCTSDFEIDDQGRYTYDGKLVIAAATHSCTVATTGVCAQYNWLPEGFHEYDLYDEIMVEINGSRHNGIVLDVCGGSYFDEPVQRYDIFVSSKEYARDIRGKVHFPIRFKWQLMAIYMVAVYMTDYMIKKRDEYEKIRRKR